VVKGALMMFAVPSIYEIPPQTQQKRKQQEQKAL